MSASANNDAAKVTGMAAAAAAATAGEVASSGFSGDSGARRRRCRHFTPHFGGVAKLLEPSAVQRAFAAACCRVALQRIGTSRRRLRLRLRRLDPLWRFLAPLCRRWRNQLLLARRLSRHAPSNRLLLNCNRAAMTPPMRRRQIGREETHTHTHALAHYSSTILFSSVQFSSLKTN